MHTLPTGLPGNFMRGWFPLRGLAPLRGRIEYSGVDMVQGCESFPIRCCSKASLRLGPLHLQKHSINYRKKQFPKHYLIPPQYLGDPSLARVVAESFMVLAEHEDQQRRQHGRGSTLQIPISTPCLPPASLPTPASATLPPPLSGSNPWRVSDPCSAWANCTNLPKPV